MKNSNPLVLIRDRETGLFMQRNIVTLAVNWVDQSHAERLTANTAHRELEYLAATKHCCHIVPADWHPNHEADSLVTRVRNFFLAIYHFFKH
jgi:hypothetical protein